jgi:hypothetical protein
MALPNLSVNVLGVFFAAVISMVIGSIWYGPLFGKTWMKLQGCTIKDIEKAKQKGMAILYFVNFIGALVLAYVLGYLMILTGMESVVGGVQLGILIWVGFISTVGLGIVLWEGKPFKLYVLVMGYWLVNLALAGAILGIF